MEPRRRGRPLKGQPSSTNPPAPVPERLRMPDGREFVTAELVNRVSNQQQYRRRNGYRPATIAELQARAQADRERRRALYARRVQGLVRQYRLRNPLADQDNQNS